MIICKQCSRAMDENYNVCPYCGIPLNAEPQTENQQNEFPHEEQYGNQPPFNNIPPCYQGAPVNGNVSEKTEIPEYTPAPRPQRSAYVAAFLAIFLGMFGAHNFYLDRKNKAIIQLVVTVAGTLITLGAAAIAMEIWAVVDAIRLLKGEINTDGKGEMIKMGF